MNFLEALQELRKQRKRNFDQTVDLIVNLKGFDIKRESVNTSVLLPHLSVKKKIAGFLENKNKNIFTITKAEIDKLSPDAVKNMARDYDFFLANAKLMPLVATKFGRILGSMGKMPDPKTGSVVMQEDEKIIQDIVSKLEKTVKIKAKESSIKIAIGKESMQDKELEENAAVALKLITEALPKKEYGIKNVMLKFTMTKAFKVKK